MVVRVHIVGNSRFTSRLIEGAARQAAYRVRFRPPRAAGNARCLPATQHFVVQFTSGCLPKHLINAYRLVPSFERLTILPLLEEETNAR
jgi:hypothetical protein